MSREQRNIRGSLSERRHRDLHHVQAIEKVGAELCAGAIALVGTWVELPRWVYWAFNVPGATLLAVVVTIAIVSIPTFALFGPDRVNTWVFGFPYVYLPAVMVQWALLGHLLVFRKLHLTSKLRAERGTQGGSDSNWSAIPERGKRSASRAL